MLLPNVHSVCCPSPGPWSLILSFVVGENIYSSSVRSRYLQVLQNVDVVLTIEDVAEVNKILRNSKIENYE